MNLDAVAALIKVLQDHVRSCPECNEHENCSKAIKINIALGQVMTNRQDLQ